METHALIAETIRIETRRLWPRGGNVTVELIADQLGQSHDIYLVNLADAPTIIARVARERGFEDLERRGIDILTHIKQQRPECPVPRIHWHNLDQTQRVAATVLQDYIPGRSLSIWNSAIPTHHRHVFLDSLAQFLVDVWSLDPPGNPSDIPYSTWLENEMDRAIRRCISGTARWGKTADYLAMRSMMPYFAQDLDGLSMARIAHGDMNAHNFIVSQGFELTGVVDWDWTFVAPLPAVVQFPWFLADIPGWHDDGTSVGETFELDRIYLVNAVKAREDSKRSDDTLSTFLATARERQMFQSAINYRDIHKEFVKSDAMLQVPRLRDITAELDGFLVKYPEYRDEPEVERIGSSASGRG